MPVKKGVDLQKTLKMNFYLYCILSKIFARKLKLKWIEKLQISLTHHL